MTNSLLIVAPPYKDTQNNQPSIKPINNRQQAIMKISSSLSLLALAASRPLGAQGFAPIANVPKLATPMPTGTYSYSLSPNKLHMASQVENEEGKGPYVNLRLVGQQAVNQALLGSTIWTGGVSFQVLTQNAHFDPSGVALGVLGLIPLLAFSQKVEKSESPLFAGLNLSTNAVLLRMFGSTQQKEVAFAVSALLAGLTGVAEETVFRGTLLPVLAEWSKVNMGVDHPVAAGVALSTLIFAALHANPTSLFRGKEALQENLVLLAFQLVTGGIFASLYVATGNLAVPIVAHALYDFVTFYKTHLDVTGQIQYATNEKLMPSTEFGVETKWKEERGENFVNNAREVFYLMDTNKDGVLSRKELRVALFEYDINLSKMDSETVTETADLDGSGEIDFGEFLEFIGPQGSTAKAVKYAMVGSV